MAVGLVVLLVSPLGAAEAIKSGPQPDDSIPGPFHFLNLNGDHADNLHCLVCEYGLKPTVVVFAHESAAGSKELGTLLQKLDEAVGKHKNARLRSFAVLLSENFPKEEGREDLVGKLKKWVADLELKQLVVTVDGPAGPEAYKLNKDADITVLVYQNQKVLANYAFGKDQLGEKDIGAILSEVSKMVGAKQ